MVNKKRNPHKLDVIFLLIFAFIQFPIRLDGFKWVTSIIIYVIPFIYILYNIKLLSLILKKSIKGMLSIPVFIFAYLFIISILLPILKDTYDFSFILEYWSVFFVLLIKNVFLVLVFYKRFSNVPNAISLENYIKYYCYSLILYIFFSSLLLIFPSLKNFLLDILYLSEKNRNDSMNPSYITRFGWSGWSGFDFTLWCSLGVVFCSGFIVRNIRSIRNQAKYLFFIFFLILGNFFYGRTGIAVSAIFFLITIICALFYFDIKYLFVIFLLCLFSSFVLLVLKENNDTIAIWFDWAFSAFINLVEKGTFSDNIGSTSALYQMYWMPELETLIYGDARYSGENGYYLLTDVGFMRHTLYFGFINYMLEIISSLIIIFKFSSFFNNYGRGISYFIIFLSFSLFLFFFELKGESFFYIISIILPICLLLNYHRNEV